MRTRAIRDGAWVVAAVRATVRFAQRNALAAARDAAPALQSVVKAACVRNAANARIIAKAAVAEITTRLRVRAAMNATS